MNINSWMDLFLADTVEPTANSVTGQSTKNSVANAEDLTLLSGHRSDKPHFCYCNAQIYLVQEQ